MHLNLVEAEPSADRCKSLIIVLDHAQLSSGYVSLMEQHQVVLAGGDWPAMTTCASTPEVSCM